MTQPPNTVSFYKLMIILLLPVLGVVALVGGKEYHVSTATTVQMPILGYDPRDLLYGHYLSFRIDSNDPAISKYESYRYFVPEDTAPILDSILHDRQHKLSVDVHVSRGRIPDFGNLYIDGMEWHSYLAQRK